MKSANKFIIGVLIVLVSVTIVYVNKEKIIGEFSVKRGVPTVDTTVDTKNDMPSIEGLAALTLDVDDNKIVYEKNIYDRMYPASTTKLLTAQVFADNKNKNSQIVYTRDAKSQPADKVDLNVGETLTGDEAMNSLLIYSANDIAVAIGENVSDNIPDFAQKMNKKASSLGDKQSNFENANGLPNEEHYTTAYDLCLIAKNAYKYQWIMDVLSKKKYVLKAERGDIHLVNTNKLLGVNGCFAGKTGYTFKAGKCLVAYYERNNKRMIGIVLHSVNNLSVDNDMEKIIDWSYGKIN